jgi:hypothetical protein
MALADSSNLKSAIAPSALMPNPILIPKRTCLALTTAPYGLGRFGRNRFSRLDHKTHLRAWSQHQGKGVLCLPRGTNILLSKQIKLRESSSNLVQFKLDHFKLEAKNDLYLYHVPHRFKSKSCG